MVLHIKSDYLHMHKKKNQKKTSQLRVERNFKTIMPQASNNDALFFY